VFEIHHDGVFIKNPTLKYELGKVMTVHVCKSNRMKFDALLDMLSSKLGQDIRYVYFCSPRVRKIKPQHKDL
jgi:hypothetical protein